MEETVLQLTNINKHFGNYQALKDVNFSLNKGEVHCLVGENGCGKSTLIKIISGVYTPDKGAKIIIGNNHSVNKVTPQMATTNGIHVIWQDLSLFPQLSVAENIAFDHFVSKPIRKPNKSEIKQQAKAVMERLGIHLDLDVPLSSLGIAQRQLVAICRVLNADARIIFMDEPTASLTRSEVNHLLDAVKKMQADGISVVFVSHRLAEVLDIADRVTVIRDGTIIDVLDAKTTNPKILSQLMTGLDLEDNVRQPKTFSEPILEVKSLSRKGEFHNINFTLHKGKIVGITGLLGAGRTELALSLFGMCSPDSGEIILNGMPMRFRHNRDAIQAGIAYVSEDRLNLGLIQPQSIRDNTTMAILDKLSGWLGSLMPKALTKTTQYWLEKLTVKYQDSSLPVNSLSGGNQQRVAIGKWLATDPKILILDAPTVGVDVGAKAEIFKVVRELAKQGLAILIISDEVSEVYYQCDRVHVMKKGTLVAHFEPHKITEESLEEAVYG
ncbi:sugar ABC transporter ATP-binding protein [Pasteurella skyensis]|uniref:Sugar ABC transporter ATP-binding protein n=1 Tax=Phocoenobacter skyensis TaxID=97481 RepID=A0AAJ6NAR6_9PAST|nr:sugar ABC transporter ATP-binding protein [Pasteurella skyensis]MDP8161545.1 sugar ABC transporter ATP-binding protein [Pasteurella skyensis]MDP8173379.1 sugar ABC transporter ATP-binding protein [Pasteurella skyensis]MDP8175939.1 sugar ABC transporter ATP-binding protein [Pasteurella skyensis]MDP8177907.1 sugar ABC transporter ATP-binding protein [Pasteurella skyensis]MDP8182434.1 sugar ABC transporter ATP-binding protein [Pasteurella skyensis]